MWAVNAWNLAPPLLLLKEGRKGGRKKRKMASESFSTWNKKKESKPFGTGMICHWPVSALWEERHKRGKEKWRRGSERGMKAKRMLKDRKWVEGLLSLSEETRRTVWQEPGQGSYCHWAFSAHYPPAHLLPSLPVFISTFLCSPLHICHHFLCITLLAFLLFTCSWFRPPFFLSITRKTNWWSCK